MRLILHPLWKMILQKTSLWESELSECTTRRWNLVTIRPVVPTLLYSRNACHSGHVASHLFCLNGWIIPKISQYFAKWRITFHSIQAHTRAAGPNICFYAASYFACTGKLRHGASNCGQNVRSRRNISPYSGHLRQRKTNRELGSSEIIRISVQELEIWS